MKFDWLIESNMLNGIRWNKVDTCIVPIGHSVYLCKEILPQTFYPTKTISKLLHLESEEFLKQKQEVSKAIHN